MDNPRAVRGTATKNLRIRGIKGSPSSTETNRITDMVM
jgi:hypothetical protein